MSEAGEGRRPRRYMVSTVLYVELESDDIFGVVPVVDRVMQERGVTAGLAEVGANAVRLTYDQEEIRDLPDFPDPGD